MKAYMAEFFGTFWLVLGGCGSAVLALRFPEFGLGFLGVSLAFGLTVLTMAYAIGHISGCHLNPAVSVGLWASGRFAANRLLPYVVGHAAGAIAASRGGPNTCAVTPRRNTTAARRAFRMPARSVASPSSACS